MKKEKMTPIEASLFVFNKMCEKINVNPKTINPKEDFWFWKHTWTQKENDEFVDWIADEIYNNNEFRKAFTTLQYRASKKLRIKTGNSFVNNFGWKIKE